MILYEIAPPIFQTEPLSVFLQSTEEVEQGGPLGVRQSTNPFSQFVRGHRGHGGGVIALSSSEADSLSPDRSHSRSTWKAWA
jgi:hypothetical protein